MKSTPRLQLVFPFTPGLVGIPEKEVQKVHNRPFSAILQEISKNTGWECEQVYFSDLKKAYKIEGKIKYRFFPLSFRRNANSRRNGMQWSISQMINFLIKPPKLLAIFFAYGGFAKALSFLARLHRVPYIVIVGGWYNQINNSQKWYYDHAFKVLVHTEMQKETLIKVGYQGNNIDIFPVGVDTDLFRPKELSSYDVRKDWPQLLYVGRLQASKGVVEALLAFEAVKRHYPNARLKIVGPCNDDNFQKGLIKLIKDWRLFEAVTLTGLISYENLPATYRQADLFLFPSPYEGLPYVVLESMACGTPPVVIRGSGGTEEVVIHEEVGWVVDMPRLAYELVAILSDPQKIKTAGIKASKRVKEVYSFERTYNNLVSILKTISS